MAGNRDKNQEERELIAATLNDLADSISELESRIEFMQEDLSARKERLATWRRRLILLNQGPSAERHRRRPKGENFRAVLGCLQGAVAGLAASEIQRRTELAWSSIQATLKRHPDTFVERDGLWRLNTPTVPPTSNGTRRRLSLSDINEALAVENDQSDDFSEDPEEPEEFEDESEPDEEEPEPDEENEDG
jgi:hypothetical protein